MDQHQHLGLVDAAQPNPEKIADPDADRHLHAVQGAAQNDALAMKFDPPHAAIGTAVLRVEADRKRKRVEPQGEVQITGTPGNTRLRPVRGQARRDGVGRFAVICWSLLGPHGDPSDTTSLPAETGPRAAKGDLSKSLKFEGSGA